MEGVGFLEKGEKSVGKSMALPLTFSGGLVFFQFF